MHGHNYAGKSNVILCRTCGKLHIHHRPRQGSHMSEQSKKSMIEKKKGKHVSPETEFKKGAIPWYKGKHLSEEEKRKISETLKRKGIRPPVIYGREPWNKGQHWSDQIRQKLSESHKGYVMTPEHRINLGLAHLGEKHWNWKGGVSGRDYEHNFPESLREKVRQRDKYTCQDCGKKQTELNGGLKRLDVHHIDFDKKNSMIENLVSLCRECHIHVHLSDFRGREMLQEVKM